MGPGVDADQVPQVIGNIIDAYVAARQEGEDFSAVYDHWEKMCLGGSLCRS